MFSCRLRDISYSFEHFSGKVRLFPLPNLVLFPHVMQPLHIFEPRYRDLLEDALAGDRLIAMAVLTPGWEKNYEGRPPLYSRRRVSAGSRRTTGWPTARTTCCSWGCGGVRLVRELSPGAAVSRGGSRVVQGRVFRLFAWPGRRCCASDLREAMLQLLPNLPEAQEQLDQLLEDDVPLGMSRRM